MLNRQYIVDNDFVAKYVNKELSDTERDAFEIFFLDDAETLAEIEATAAVLQSKVSSKSSANSIVMPRLPPGPSRYRYWPLPVAAALAATIVIVVGIGVRDPSAPAILVDAVIVDIGVRRTQDDMERITLPTTAGVVLLRIAVGRSELPYRVTLTDADGTRVSSQPMVSDAFGDVLVSVKPLHLESDVYTLTVAGVDSDAPLLETLLTVGVDL